MWSDDWVCLPCDGLLSDERESGMSRHVGGLSGLGERFRLGARPRKPMGLGRGRVCAPALIAWAGLTALAAFAAMAALAPVALADTMSLTLSREAPHASSHASRGVHGHARARKHAHHLAGSRARVRACRAESLGRYIVTIHARGISCVSARSVVGAAEHTPLPADVVRTPYFKYSPPYTVSTPAGRFVCRFEPFGLAGTEHNIRCTRARVLVRWSTVQE